MFCGTASEVDDELCAISAGFLRSGVSWAYR
jgi:hypothetical protein